VIGVARSAFGHTTNYCNLLRSDHESVLGVTRMGPGSDPGGGARRTSQEEPGGTKGTQEESGGDRRSQEYPKGARSTQEEPGGAKSSQEEPGKARSQE
jgi:hypothetical protein